MSSQDDERLANEAEELADEDSGVFNVGAKKRKLQRACDICRRRKVRCDGAEMPGNRCTNCKNGNLHCTYVESRVKRVSTKPPVETLQTRLEKMERMVSHALAEGDYGTSPVPEPDKDSSSQKLSLGVASLPFLSPEDVPEVDDDALSSSDEEAGAVQLSYNMHKLSVDSTLQRFFGKSSGPVFLTTAMDIKNKYTQKEAQKVLRVRRPEFWTVQPWVREKIMSAKTDYNFPEEDLLWTLINLYFTYVNPFLPLLHRPTFEQQVIHGLHRRDGGFGGTVSLVCALGARFSDDPRVLLKGTDSVYSAGWAWYDQVQILRNSGLAPPSIYEIQSCSLAACYLLGCSSPQATWNIVGIGLRLIQDVGAHRKKVYQENPTVSDELWRRAFWCLVLTDRANSIATGRAPALNDEDFDLDLPTEVDDEFWDNLDPNLAFKQPHEKPSVISFFCALLKLNQIAAFALRTIYSINRSKLLLGYVGPKWQQSIVAQLDSALNKWMDNIPDHLRWDPNRENGPFFDQSAILYAYYYHTQILVHRPFIPKPHKPSSLSFPSLAICTNAARSCSHLVDIQRKRRSKLLHFSLLPTFTAGVVLLLNIWGATKSGVRIDRDREMEDVHKCMQILLACETRCHFAGRFWDTLRDLAEAGKLPLPDPSTSISKKRSRTSNMPSLSSTTTKSSEPDRHLAGVPRFSYASDHSSSGSSPSPQPFPYAIDSAGTLPTHTADLGKMPLHRGAKYPINPNFAEVKSESCVSTGTAFQSLQPASQTSPLSADSRAGNERDQGTASTWLDPPANYEFGGMMRSGHDEAPATSSGGFGSNSFEMQGQSLAPQQPPIHMQQSRIAPPTFIPQVMENVLNTESPEFLGILFPQPQTQQQQTYDPNAEAYLHSDTLQMWSTAPSGFEVGDWCDYLDNVNAIQGLSLTNDVRMDGDGLT